jgi:cellulose synthase/poly-beta-1,6-N-acetylglucosamine synthase-like glycosyltransferase
MGRVVPHNVDQNLLTRLLDLERSGGYQVDQQARMNMKLVPQYGGTVGGVRKSALLHAGGWRIDTLAEDTDATFRLLRHGWKTVYQNRSECYEQVPSTWPVRLRQVLRWARGHNQALAAHGLPLLVNRRVSLRERIDGFALLNVYLMSPVLLLGWLLGVVLWYLGETRPGLIVILAVTSYSTVGNFATFFEVTAAAYLDGSRERIRLLPFVLLGFLVSLLSVTADALLQLVPRWSREVRWHRTEHTDRFNGEENGWE